MVVIDERSLPRARPSQTGPASHSTLVRRRGRSWGDPDCALRHRRPAPAAQLRLACRRVRRQAAVS